MSRKQPRSELAEISRLAFANALDMSLEAKQLLKVRESPRAYALCVTSIEELVKSFYYDILWKEDKDPDNVVDRGHSVDVEDHSTKHRMLGAILLHIQDRKGGREKIDATKDSLDSQPDEIFPLLKDYPESHALVTQMERRRKASLYVGLKSVKGQIPRPKGEITITMCEELLRMNEQIIALVRLSRGTSAERYLATKKSLDLTRRTRAVD